MTRSVDRSQRDFIPGAVEMNQFEVGGTVDVYFLEHFMGHVCADRHTEDSARQAIER